MDEHRRARLADELRARAHLGPHAAALFARTRSGRGRTSTSIRRGWSRLRRRHAGVARTLADLGRCRAWTRLVRHDARNGGEGFDAGAADRVRARLTGISAAMTVRRDRT